MDIVLRSAGHFTACQITLRSNKGNNEDDKCWICGEKGHISRDCPKNRNNKKQESNKEEEDEDNVKMMTTMTPLEVFNIQSHKAKRKRRTKERTKRRVVMKKMD